MNTLRLACTDGAGYVRAFLGSHAARLREALREKDRGASAIELAVITAVLVGLAVFVVTIIYNYTRTQANTIQGNQPPGGGGGGGNGGGGGGGNP
jgi:hypothetical protein